MITPALKDAGFDTRHILKDNTVVSTEVIENNLLEKFKKKIPETDLYLDRKEKLKRAFQLLNEKIGYTSSL
jgi:hypothetical protein